jgi:hypothetical protein
MKLCSKVTALRFISAYFWSVAKPVIVAKMQKTLLLRKDLVVGKKIT